MPWHGEIAGKARKRASATAQQDWRGGRWEGVDETAVEVHGHAVTRLAVHLVWATRGRALWLDAAVDGWLLAFLSERCTQLGCKALAVGNAPDHVHALVPFAPALSIASLVHRLKGASRRAFSLQFGRHLEWQVGYYAETASESDALVAYIRGQREYHRAAHAPEAWELAACPWSKRPPPGG
jgi:putative transposase